MRPLILVLALLYTLAVVAGGKGVLVLQCGSDWCVSGENVRRVFESKEFKKALGGRYELRVYDDMEEPPPKVKETNEKLERLRVETKRFPAITCLTEEPRRLFAQLENIPFDVTSESLAAMIEEAANNLKTAEAHFKHGRGKNAMAADALGAGFEILEAQVGEFNVSQLYDGPFAWKEQWEHLKEIDADDRFGWLRRFTMGYGFDIVEMANSLARAGNVDEGEKYLAKLQSIPTNHLAVVQRQALEMARFAYTRTGSASSVIDTALMYRVLDMGRDTVWGQCAIGFLKMAGETIEITPPHRAEMPERPQAAADGARESGVSPLGKITARLVALKPNPDGFSEQEKRDIALYAVLSRIGEDGWRALKSRPGSKDFIRAFFSNREWMEDFVWSGNCSNAKASILALEALYFQDNGRWLNSEDGCGRRFVTATALEKPDTDEAWLADWLDAYRSTALSNRLHKTAYSQPVWQWRYAIRQIHSDRNVDDPPNQQRFLDTFCNMPAMRMGGAHCFVPYRKFNCFGESIHTPQYYEPWVRAGEWPKRKYSYIVGGVCGELSTFGSCCSNAHGLPSIPVGQPGHCAYTRRLPDGTWQINNFIVNPTGFVSFWPNGGHWTYMSAVEATFEGAREKRLDADRFIELARLAERKSENPAKIMRLYRRACNSWHGHYTAWREYGDWIVRAHRPIEEHRTYCRAAVKALPSLRHPLWDLLTPYFERIASEQGAESLTSAIAEFAPLLRQPDEQLQDNGDIAQVVKRWAKPLEGNPQLMGKAVESFVAGQYGTPTYFAQILGWCAPFVFADDKRADAFLKTLPKLAEKFAKTMRGVKGGAQAVNEAKRGKPDLGAFILAAESAGDIAAFRKFAAMQEKIGESVKGAWFKDKDFGGVLVSAEGMLTLSATAPAWIDTPALHPRAIDASPASDFMFCADESDAPWAKVTLAGPCELRGIVIVLRSADKAQRENQLPLVVEISEDGSDWQKVYEDNRLRDQYRIEFKAFKRPRARYVRVSRAQSETSDGRIKRDYFRLSKILVYGKKLY